MYHGQLSTGLRSKRLAAIRWIKRLTHRDSNIDHSQEILLERIRLLEYDMETLIAKVDTLLADIERWQ